METARCLHVLLGFEVEGHFAAIHLHSLREHASQMGKRIGADVGPLHRARRAMECIRDLQARDDVTGNTSKYFTMARMGLP